MIKIFNKNDTKKKISQETFFFPGGEVGVRINPAQHWVDENSFITVVSRITSSNDVMELLLTMDALKRAYPYLGGVELLLPYFPYARQDRVSLPGESLSLKVMAKLINDLKFDAVKVFDPHSGALELLLDNDIFVSQLDIISNFPEINKFVMENDAIIVSPDAGAQKKAWTISEYFGHRSMVMATKERDPKTGKLSNPKITNPQDVFDRNCLIVDDICDGGGTFIALAKELYLAGAKSVSLYVTHGIFSKGTRVLRNAGITNIFTTNSYADTPHAGVDSQVVILRVA